jgi:oligopeptide transport system permease protein
MAKYVARRVLHMALVLVGASMVLFVCLFVVPGDPVATSQGEGREIDADTRAILEKRYHLDDPLPNQYLYYLGRLVRGDMGESYSFRRPVNEMLAEKLPNTMRLGVAALVLHAFLGVAAGVIATVSRYSFLDVLLTVSTTVAIAVPTFVVGLALQNVFAVELRWLPVQGRHAGPQAMILPAITLAAVDTALIARLTRASVLEVMQADYIRTAMAKGLPRHVVILKHALRNSVIPVLTYLGITFGTLLGGAVVTEAIFNWDGLGSALVNAFHSQDNPVVMAVVTYGVAVFVLVNLVVDVFYAFLDPRIRLE